MKSLQYKLIVLMIVSSIFTLSSLEETDNRFEHKIIAGFNIGATAPTSIPAEIRSIDDGGHSLHHNWVIMSHISSIKNGD